MTNSTDPDATRRRIDIQPPPPAQPAPQYAQQPQYVQQPQYRQPHQPMPHQMPSAPGAPGAPLHHHAPSSQRPKTPIAGALMIGGAVLALIGTLLPWVSVSGESGNGFEQYVWVRDFSLTEVDAPGIAVVIGAVIMLALGITTLLAGRLLPVTIIAMISAGLGILGGAGLLVLISDFAKFADADLGIGLLIQPIAPMVCLVGAIMATAARTKHAA